MEIGPGTQVYGRRGGYVGVVLAAGADVLRIRAATPLAQTYYVPRAAVIGTLPGGHEIFINCLLDDLERMGWQHPPHSAFSAT